MTNIKLAIRSLFKGNQSIIKIVSLGVSLSIGLVLMSKVILDQSYDHFYPDKDRIYRIEYKYTDGSENFEGISGGITVDMKEEIPEIESSTRFVRFSLGKEVKFTINNNEHIAKNGMTYADEFIFDVLSRPMIMGDAKEILSKPNYALISQSIAEKLGHKTIGEIISIDDNDITIGGIFEDIPYNSITKYDIVVSLSTMGEKFAEGWQGGEWFYGFVKLRPGVKPTDLEYPIQKLREIKTPNIKTNITFYLNPLTHLHSNNNNVKKMGALLAAIAVVLLGTGVLNYVLITTTNLFKKGKDIAIYKTYGANVGDILKQTFATTNLDLILSLVLSLLIIFTFRGTIEELLSTPISGLFIKSNLIWLFSICITISLIIGFAPTYLLSKIPVSSIFQRFSQTNSWKLVLLSFQFIITTFIFAFLVIISKQYQMMKTFDLGYNSENLAYTYIGGIQKESRRKLIETIKSLPEVKMVGVNSEMHIGGISGNYILFENNDKILVADFDATDENFYRTLEIPIIEGKGFDENSIDNDVLISKLLADKLKAVNKWDDIISKSIIMQPNKILRIVGVYPDLKIKSLESTDERPSIMPYKTDFGLIPHLNIKFHDLNATNMIKVQNALDKLSPDIKLNINVYSDKLIKMYNKSRLFRNTVVIGGLITFILGIIGLIAYTNNQISSKQKEIAIRKINGARFSEILKLFLSKIFIIALPSIFLGCIFAKITANKWMLNFSEKINLSFMLFLGCACVVLLIINTIIYLSCLKISRQNPVDSLYKE